MGWADLARRLLLTGEQPLELRIGRAGIGWLVGLYAAAALAAPLLYLGWHLEAYADGSYFSFALLARQSWDYVWSNFPGRLSTFLLCVEPAAAWLALTGDDAGALRLYGMLFGAMPLLGLLASLAVLPRHARGELLWPAVSFLVFGLLTLGFPTETWLTQSAFWPLLFAIRHLPEHPAGRRGHLAALVLLGAVYVFSHEAMVLGLPLLALAALRLRGGPGGRRLLATVAAVFAALLLAWVAVKVGLRPPNAETTERVAANQFSLLMPKAQLTNPLLQKAGIVLALLVPAWLLWPRFLQTSRARRAAILSVAAAVLAAALVAAWGLYGPHRYAARAVVLFATPALGLLCLLTRLDTGEALPAGDRPRVRFDAWPYLPVVVLALVLHLGEGAKFLREWARFSALLGAVADGRAPLEGQPSLGLLPEGEPPPPAGPGQGFPGRDTPWQLSWNWTLPFNSFLVAEGFAPRQIVHNRYARYDPVSCDQLRALAVAGTGLGEHGLRLLRDYACAHGRPPG
ncbi:hypothetical protein M0638_08560 [Roseomonas sp. NAR14]|uniref:Uncharacterized protein n=1 Tax=Roseomonas acroporae TaxID=2937791 RepID=A0A9X1Y561_9PROT|nr:hypothetical protein [Roseomonas acroporae]MCK8784429.1 hypothetical protein [Roseomonas acroporae]